MAAPDGQNVDLGQCDLSGDAVLPLLSTPHLARLRLFGNAKLGAALTALLGDSSGAQLHEAAAAASALHDLDLGDCSLTHACVGVTGCWLRTCRRFF